MRYLNALALVAVAVFLIGTNSTEVFAKRPSNPPELEQRVTDLEGQVADHETRITNLEQQTSPNWKRVSENYSLYLTSWEKGGGCAWCPEGMVVVSGGIYMDPAGGVECDPNTRQLLLSDSYPAHESTGVECDSVVRSGWCANFVYYPIGSCGGVSTFKVTIHAICAKCSDQWDAANP